MISCMTKVIAVLSLLGLSLSEVYGSEKTKDLLFDQ